MKVTEKTMADTLYGDSIWENAMSLQKAMADAQVPAALHERLEKVTTDYQYMCDFFQQGFRDPSAESVYKQMQNELYAISVDVATEKLKRKRVSYMKAVGNAAHFNGDVLAVKAELERYVQDTAMLDLYDEADRKIKEHDIHVRHYSYMKALFSHILVCGMWTSAQREAYVSLLLSPTIDVADAMLIVSALTLSLSNVFDPNKWLTLLHTYLDASEPLLGQRALVGWALFMPRPFPESRIANFDLLLLRIQAHAPLLKDLAELQTQVMFCCKAESDTAEIQKEIIPKLMENGNFKMTRLGIEEKDDNAMDDILGNGENDRRMEEMESTFRKMQNMQREGSDVFFGGFSQMKRFPFFNEICNWFWPYTPVHPLLSDVYKKTDGSQNFSKMLLRSPFCDSDKYSFVFAFSSVLHQLPAQVREGIQSRQLTFGPEMNDDDKHSRPYIRRIYLQNLYRFFRLNSGKADFNDPFSVDADCPSLFMTNELMCRVFGKTYAKTVSDLATFLYGHKMYAVLDCLLDTVQLGDQDVMRAKVLMGKGRYAEAYALVADTDLGSSADDVLSCVAQCAFALQRYDVAAGAYGELSQRQPSRFVFALKYAVCLLGENKVEQAMRHLYKLDFEHPDNINVTRALAWGLLLKKEADKALARYQKLQADERAVPADYLNGGYAQWLTGHLAEAVGSFARYCALSRGKDVDVIRTLRAQFDKDVELFGIYHINKVEQCLMQDVVARRVAQHKE